MLKFGKPHARPCAKIDFIQRVHDLHPRIQALGQYLRRLAASALRAGLNGGDGAIRQSDCKLVGLNQASVAEGDLRTSARKYFSYLCMHCMADQKYLNRHFEGNRVIININYRTSK